MAAAGAATDRLEAEVQALRNELAEMRNEQREMARAIEQLVQTFRTLAVHLGIASEPYQKPAGSAKGRDIPGFG
jgi:prefoldin subunit 5